MSNKNKNKVSASPKAAPPAPPSEPETPEAGDDSGDIAGTGETPKTPLTKAEIKALVTAYVEADDAVIEAEALVETAAKDREAAARAIYEASGKGKYKVRDEVLILTARKTRNGDGVSVYFKRKEEDDDIIGGD